MQCTSTLHVHPWYRVSSLYIVIRQRMLTISSLPVFSDTYLHALIHASLPSRTATSPADANPTTTSHPLEPVKSNAHSGYDEQNISPPSRNGSISWRAKMSNSEPCSTFPRRTDRGLVRDPLVEASRSRKEVYR